MSIAPTRLPVAIQVIRQTLYIAAVNPHDINLTAIIVSVVIPITGSRCVFFRPLWPKAAENSSYRTSHALFLSYPTDSRLY